MRKRLSRVSLRRGAGLLVASCGIASVAVVYLGATSPIGGRSSDAQTPSLRGASILSDVRLPLTASASWDRDLRQPLADFTASASIVDPAPTSAPAVPGFHLAGTIVEPGHCMAIFRDPNGAMSFKAVGDVIDHATLVSVAEEGAVLLWNGRTVTVQIEPAPPALPPAGSSIAGTQRPAEPSVVDPPAPGDSHAEGESPGVVSGLEPQPGDQVLDDAAVQRLLNGELFKKKTPAP